MKRFRFYHAFFKDNFHILPYIAINRNDPRLMADSIEIAFGWMFWHFCLQWITGKFKKGKNNG